MIGITKWLTTRFDIDGYVVYDESLMGGKNGFDQEENCPIMEIERSVEKNRNQFDCCGEYRNFYLSRSEVMNFFLVVFNDFFET